MGWATCPSARASGDRATRCFYEWGSDFWFRYQRDQLGEDNEPLQKHLRAWGFEEPTGIDLPGEANGFLPDAEWGNDPDQRDLFGQTGWNPGGYILTMIGSGYMSVTPLQLAAAYGAIANDGHLCRPHVVDRIMASDGETVLKQIHGGCDRTVPYTKSELDYIRNALTQVPVSGTAALPFQGFPLSEVPVAGKTGTAFRGTPFQDTSWFAAMVPANDPKYVVVAMVEQAGFGSDVAAPLVRRMIEDDVRHRARRTGHHPRRGRTDGRRRGSRLGRRAPAGQAPRPDAAHRHGRRSS